MTKQKDTQFLNLFLQTIKTFMTSSTRLQLTHT